MNIEVLYDKFSVTSGVSTDTRSIEPNQMFFALKGEHFNGNKYAKEALQKGAIYAVVDEEEFAENDEQYIVVNNCLEALQQLANFHRKMLRTPMIAITGSNGKTTTKELIHAVLSMRFETFATKGNLNNHIGVPLSLLSLTTAHQIAIIEMGANHLGEIAELCKIAQPNFGLITNIGTAHIEGFGSQENIQKGKAELYQYLQKQQKEAVFVNSDDALLLSLSDHLEQITYGRSSEFFTGSIEESDPTMRLTIDDSEQEFTITTHLFGEYNFTNALAAGAVGKHFGIPLLDIAEAIEQYRPANHRSQIIEKDDTTYIVDAYNANISSMRAALEQFAKLKAENKLAVLGSMLEHGELEEAAHQEVVELIHSYSIPAIFVGKEFKGIAPEEQWFASVDEAKKEILNRNLSNTTVLLKGSRGIQLEKLLPQ